MGNQILKGTKNAYKFTVITLHEKEIIQDIYTVLKHGVTKVTAIGTHSGSQRAMLICVVNKHQINDFQQILAKYDDTFSYYEQVNETMGNFRRIK